MTDLAALTARAEAWNDNNTPWRSVSDAEALIRDLLTYATTVSQERDAVERSITAAEFRIATLCEAHEAQFIRADHAEQERDAAIARAEQAERVIRDVIERQAFGIFGHD